MALELVLNKGLKNKQNNEKEKERKTA